MLRTIWTARVRSVIAALVIAATVLSGGSTVAFAVNGQLGQYFYDGVNIRTGPYLSATVLGLGYYGQEICTDFTAEGDTVNSNPYWAHHKNRSTGVIGYSSWEFLGIYGPPPTGCSY